MAVSLLILANSQAKECVNYCEPGVAALFAATFFRIVGSCPGDDVATSKRRLSGWRNQSVRNMPARRVLCMYESLQIERKAWLWIWRFE